MVKKIAILRASTQPLKLNSYNVQEIGFARGLLKHGISTDIYSKFLNETNEKIIESNGDACIRIIPLIEEINILGKISFFKGIIDRIINANYNLVQLHEEALVMTPLTLTKRNYNNTKFVLYQGMYEGYSGIGKLIQLLYDFILKNININKPDFVFAKTTKAKSYLQNKGFKSVQISPVGLDVNTLSDNFEEDIHIANFKKNHDKIISYIGVIEQRRNPDFIVDIAERKKHQNYGFIIVGNGPLKNQMISKVKSLNLELNFLFIDSIPNKNINIVYKNSDLFILPSNYEIYGMVLLEALYFGVPVLATRTAGGIDIIENTSFGKCIDLNIKDWCDAIDNIINQDFDFNSMRQYVLNNYSWEKIAKQYIKLTSL